MAGALPADEAAGVEQMDLGGVDGNEIMIQPGVVELDGVQQIAACRQRACAGEHRSQHERRGAHAAQELQKGKGGALHNIKTPDRWLRSAAKAGHAPFPAGVEPGCEGAGADSMAEDADPQYS